MSYLDTLYRAFIDFRKNTADDRDCASARRAIAKADADKDCVEISRVVCKIEQDWIDAIESGLEFVEKSLAEERQFIRANGEIVPIEKVKRVSRDSVEHLSRHSNLITKESKGEDLIPEQLYTVERLNDYAVYENRFLYMLLTYLEEFISMRYTKILDLTNTYNGTAALNKTVKSRQKEISFELKLDEKRRDDPIMIELNPNKAVIERIGMLLKTVNHYLSTPLMEEVSKVAKLKPPITKTNVLKMDKNFKGAVALYEFIAAYDKAGYTVETVKKKMKFSDFVSDEFAEIYMLSSFLTYEYGMGIKDMLKANYEDEENRRRAIAEEQYLDQLRKLRRRITENGDNPEEYMLLLEKQLRMFEGIHTKLDDALAETARLKDENVKLNNVITELNDKADELRSEIARLEQKYIDDMAERAAEHAAEIVELNAAHAKETEELNENWKAQIEFAEEQHRDELDFQRDKYEREITDMQSAHNNEILELNSAHEQSDKQKSACIDSLTAENAAIRKAQQNAQAEYDAKLAAKVAEFDKEIRNKEKAISDVKEENRLLADLKTLSDGRLNALRFQHGLMTAADDFTTENAFNEIENQYNIFRRFFKGEWKKTKKKIRDELFRAHKIVSSSAEDSDEIKELENDKAEKPAETVEMPKAATTRKKVETANKAVAEEKSNTAESENGKAEAEPKAAAKDGITTDGDNA